MTRHPKPGELWKARKYTGIPSRGKWVEFIILVKDVDNLIDDHGRKRFIAIDYRDSMTVNNALEDCDFEWELIQSI